MNNRSGEPTIPDDLWKLTLSDLLTLIMSFFVLRLSTLQFEQPPIIEIPGSIVSNGETSNGTIGLSGESPLSLEQKDSGCYSAACRAISDRLEVVLGSAGKSGPLEREFEHHIGIRSDEYLTEVVLGSGTFPPGSSELTFGAYRAVMAVGRGINSRPAQTRPDRIEVKAYAEEPAEQEPDQDAGIGSQDSPPEADTQPGGSSWDLANARAMTVIRQLLDAGVDSNLITISGFGRSPALGRQRKSESLWDDPRALITVVYAPLPNKPVASE